MSVNTAEILAALTELAPLSLAEEWDNVGLIAGDDRQEVNTVYLCLDVTSENIREAAGAELIISHHPPIFAPIKKLTARTAEGNIVISLIRSGMSLISMHTNLDRAQGGLNDELAKKLFVGYTSPLPRFGLIGRLDAEMTVGEYAAKIGAHRFTGDPGRRISRVALCSGSGGGNTLDAWEAGAEAYVAGDFKHDNAILAAELGMTLIDAGHFDTEVIVTSLLREYLEKRFPSLKIVESGETPYFRNV